MPGALGISSASLSFRPRFIPGLIGDWNADVGITIATGVSQVTDAIRSNHVTQATSGSQPTRSTGWRKGHALINHGVGKFLNRSAFIAGNLAQPTTMVWIGEIAGGDAEIKGLVDSYVAPNRMFLASNVPVNQVSMWANNYVSVSKVGAAVGPAIVIGVFDGASAKLRTQINGYALLTSTGNCGANIMTGITIGSAVGGAIPPVAGGWSRVLLYGRALTTTELQKLEAYASRSYGIAP